MIENHYNNHTTHYSTINNYDINAQQFYNIQGENQKAASSKPNDATPGQGNNNEDPNFFLNLIMHQLANNKNNVNNYINKNYFVVINQCPPSASAQGSAQ